VSRILPILFLLALALAVAPHQASAHCAGGSHRVIGEVPPPPDDLDCDFVKDNVDNCPPLGYDDLRTRNPNQEDTDRDGIGDWCEADDDGDGIFDWTDRKVEYESSKVKLDNCRTVANSDQKDDNGNNVGNVCEYDNDHDGRLDSEDNCRGISNPDQADLDNDRVGDACDSDADGDYVRDTEDNCPRFPNPPIAPATTQADEDSDGLGAACDPNDAPPAPATPTPSVNPAPGPGGANPGVADHQAPRVTLRGLKRAQPLAEIEDGLVVRLTCSEACLVKASLTVDKALAKRLKLRGTTTVGAGSAQVEAAATTYAFVRFDARVRARLFKQKRAAVTLRVTVTDPSGNTRRVSAALSLRR
jgi:hypothetical protein